jgi:hypothetical protein
MQNVLQREMSLCFSEYNYVKTHVISLNNIVQLIFVMERRRVLFQV